MHVTIIELPEYIRKVEKLLDEEERNSLIFYLSTHPKSGVIIQEAAVLEK